MWPGNKIKLKVIGTQVPYVRLRLICPAYPFHFGILLLLVFSKLSSLHAQHSSLRYSIRPYSQVIQLEDSLLIDSSSIMIEHVNRQAFLDPWRYDATKKQIQISSPAGPDSLLISYRIFPFYSKAEYKLYDRSLIQQALRPEYAKPIAGPSKKENWWESTGMEYSGNFTRGISTGTNQSLLLNSNLNLQLHGDLGEGLIITGAISDNQIPIQPEGNTRQIQEFDKIYLRLSKNRQQLTAGDFEIGRPPGHFINYFKKNKGGLLESEWNVNEWKVKNTSAFAISKGKSNRQQIQTTNGNQGPYRLSGSGGEAFIIILAGSEKLWIDGQLMERGEQSDYVIDYNLAEIRFTPNRLITEQSRVTVEFEYLDQNYTRSLIAHQSQIRNERTQFYFNIFNEQDSKRPAIPTDLDSTDQRILAQAGDDPSLATRTSVSKAGSSFNVNRVYYRERDTTIIIKGNLILMNYLVYDPYADSTALQVYFSEVAEGKGNYRLKSSSANGRVYEWVSPDPATAQATGNYEPVTELIAPQSHFIANTGFGIEFKRTGKVHAEIAYSSLDLNRISSIQDGNNSGIALELEGLTPSFSLRDSNYKVQAGIRYEFIHQNFNPLNSFRPVEFTRDWNVRTLFGDNDHLPEFQIELNAGPRLKLQYKHLRLLRSSNYRGIKNIGLLAWSDSSMQVQLHYDLLQTEDTPENSRFFRPLLEIKRNFSKKILVELMANRQRNEVFSEKKDSLKSSSFSFDQFEAKVLYTANKRTSISYISKYRKDLQAATNGFKDHTDSYESTVNATLNHTILGDWELKASGRYVHFSDTVSKDSLSKLNFLGSLDQRMNLWNQSFRMRNFFEIQSGVEPRQEFVYEERRPGEGNFIYMDFNKDGIRQVFEYVYAPEIDTARFVRFQLFNSQYVQVHQSSWNQVLQLDFRNFKKPESKLLQSLQLFSLESTFRITSKTSEDASFAMRLNPFSFLGSSVTNLGYQSYLQQSLYFNRSDPQFEVQLGISQNGQKVLLTSGLDEKINFDPFIKLRWSLKKKWDLLIELHQKREERKTELFADQNYNVQTFHLRPGIQFRPNQNTRWSFYGNYKNAKDRTLNSQHAEIRSVEMASSSYLLRKLNLRLEFEYLHARFSGLNGSLLEFTVLDGFKNGDNFNWNIQLDYKIHALIQLQFIYNGRKAALNEPLHTARMQLRANF